MYKVAVVFLLGGAMVLWGGLCVSFASGKLRAGKAQRKQIK